MQMVTPANGNNASDIIFTITKKLVRLAVFPN